MLEKGVLVKNKTVVFEPSQKLYKIPFSISQKVPFHSSLQPLSHRPVTWLHGTLCLQCPRHCWMQPEPYHPAAQPELQRKSYQTILTYSFKNVYNIKYECITLNQHTCVTCWTSPSRLARFTKSTLNIAFVFFTILRA